MIKAVDSSGVESSTESLVSVNAPKVVEFNLISELVEQPGFTGTKVNTTAINGTLSLSSGATLDDQGGNWDSLGLFDSIGALGHSVLNEGTYDFSSSLDLGEVFSSRVSVNLSADVFSSSVLFDKEGMFDQSGGTFDGGDSSAAMASLLISTSQDAVSYTSYKPFIVGDYRARAFKFRLKLVSSDRVSNLRVSALAVKIEMAGRVESGSITTSLGSRTVLFDYPFRATPDIGATLLNPSQGDYTSLSGQSNRGFTIAAFNVQGLRLHGA